jgi:hypothetical protein
VPDSEKPTGPAPSTWARRPSAVAGITCVAGAVTALVGFGYILAGSVAVVDFVLLVTGLLLALVGLVRLLRRNPGN